MIGYVPSTVRVNIELRSRIMNRQIWYDQPYLRFSDFISREPAEDGYKEIAPVGNLLDTKDIKPSDKPIQIMEDFSKKEGGTKMMLPMKIAQHPRPIIGRDTASGKGYARQWVYKSVYCNLVRQVAQVKIGSMNTLPIGVWYDQLYGQAQPELTDWYRKYINTSLIKRTLFEGYDYASTVATTSFGLGLTKVSHPNLFVGGSGFVSYTAGKPASAGYETSVESALNALTTADVFSLDLVDQVVALLGRSKRIMPVIKTQQGEYYIWIITPAQKYQLQKDPRWRTIVTNMLPREGDKNAKDNWGLNSRAGVWNSSMFFEDIQGWGAHTNTNPNGWLTAPTSGKPTWGVEDVSGSSFPDMANLDDSNYQCAVILGYGTSIGVGIARRLGFTDEIRDHEEQKEVGANMVIGGARGDYYDSDAQISGNTAGDFVENTSSAIVVTYSPKVAGI